MCGILHVWRNLFKQRNLDEGLANSSSSSEVKEFDSDAGGAAHLAELATEKKVRPPVISSGNTSGTLTVVLPPCSPEEELIIAIGVIFDCPHFKSEPVDVVCSARLYDTYRALKIKAGLSSIDSRCNEDAVHHTSATRVYTLNSGLSIRTEVHTNLAGSLHGMFFISSHINPFHSDTHAQIISAVLDPVEGYDCIAPFPIR